MKALILAGGAARGCVRSPTRGRSSWSSGQQADPLLRHRGDGRRRDQGDRRDHRRCDRDRGARGARRRQRVRRQDHVHPAGSTARPGPLRADRRRLPRRRRLRDVPRRQPAGAGPRRVRRRLRAGHRSADPPAAQILLKQVPTRTASASPRSTSDGHVLRSSRSPTIHRPTSPSSASTCSTRRSTTRCGPSPSARGELEITDAIQWLITTARVRTELLTGWWIDTGKLTPLLEANRLLLEKIESRIDGAVDRVDDRRRCRRRGRGDRQLDDPWTGRDRARHAIVDSFIGPFSAIGNGLPSRGTARSSTRS